MKKIVVLLLTSLLLVGCTNYKVSTDTYDTLSSESSPQNSAHSTIVTESPELLPEYAPVIYTLYLPNENADGFITNEIESNMITPEGVLAELQRGGALPADGIKINTFHSQGDQLHIDFNNAFANAVNAMGTSGEYMIIGSVVNTFLNAFQAQSICFTVNSETFESGHVIYDFPLTFFE